MARNYRLTIARKLVNAVVRPLVRIGLGGRHTYLLTVAGRRSGRLYSTPVTLGELDGERFLVSPYGETAWVLNARAAGEVELRRTGRSERFRVSELPAAEAAPVLRAYLRKAPVTRPFFDVSAGSPLEAFAAEAGRHPVFRLTLEG
jgi:deazaflavin-dependent oxidoreductase (nitroreductase family)